MKTICSRKLPAIWHAIMSVLLASILLFILVFMTQEKSFADATYSVSIRGSDDVWSTAETPAKGRAYPSIFGGWNDLDLQFRLDYSGLVPGVTYRLDKMTIQQNSRSSWSQQNIGSFVAEEGGSGTYTGEISFGAFFWDADYTGPWSLELFIYPDGSSDKETIKATAGDMSQTLIVKGIATMEMSAEGGKNFGSVRYISTDTIREGTKAYSRVTLKELVPNTKYTINSRLHQIRGDYDFCGSSNLVARGTGTETADQNGEAVFELEYDLPNDLTAGGFLTSLFSVVPAEEPKQESFSYYFSPTQLFSFLLSITDRVYIIDKEVPKGEPTYVDVDVTNKRKGNDIILTGAKLKVVKGYDPEGDDVLDQWTQGKDPHSLRLEPGDYTLVQVTPPDGYEKADPVHFTLTYDDADIRGYYFEGNHSVLETEDSYVNALTVNRIDHADESEVVFCLNANKDFAGSVDDHNWSFLYYTEHDIADAVMNDIIENPRLEIDALRKKLLQIVYAGYPNNKAGLKEEYGLTDAELETITQLAVHYYTDSVDNSGEIAARLRPALNALINTDIDVPGGMTAKIYLPNNLNHQSVISTKFRPANLRTALEIFNEKADEPEEPEEPEPEPEEPVTPEKEEKKEDHSESGEPKGSPSLTVDKTSSVKEASPGDTIPFTIEVANKGTADAHGVKIIDLMGEDLEYVSDDLGGEVSGSTVRWESDVKAGKSQTINIRCRVKDSAAGKVINNVRIIHESFSGSVEGVADTALVMLEDEEGLSKEKKVRKTSEKDDDQEHSDQSLGEVKTGDTASITLWAALLSGAAALIVMLILKRRK